VEERDGGGPVGNSVKEGGQYIKNDPHFGGRDFEVDLHRGVGR
jgi:hypothetical protein